MNSQIFLWSRETLLSGVRKSKMGKPVATRLAEACNGSDKRQRSWCDILSGSYLKVNSNGLTLPIWGLSYCRKKSEGCESPNDRGFPTCRKTSSRHHLYSEWSTAHAVSRRQTDQHVFADLRPIFNVGRGVVKIDKWPPLTAQNLVSNCTIRDHEPPLIKILWGFEHESLSFRMTIRDTCI